MAFTIPQFNLICRIRRFIAAPYPPGGPVTGSTEHPCQLRLLKTAFCVNPTPSLRGATLLCLPKGTDIRGDINGSQYDLVEVPKASGLWYSVWQVSDVAKGFANEYRVAALNQLTAIANMWVWPQP